MTLIYLPKKNIIKVIFMNLFNKINDESSDFITYPKTFKGYRWYKPILIGILAIVIYMVLSAILLLAVMGTFHIDYMIFFNSLTNSSNYLSLDNITGIVSSISVILIIPSIFLASKIVRDRPFKSYLTLNEWNWSLFAKSMLISLIVFAIIMVIQIIIEKGQLNNHFTILTFVLCILLTPFQCFAEEYLCRGFLMQTFGSWFKIPIVAIILQAIIFTLLHGYNVTGLISVLITGLAFGFISWYSKGLEISTAIHSINNIMSFCAVGFGFAVATENVLVLDLVLSFIALIVSIGLIVFLDKKYDWIDVN